MPTQFDNDNFSRLDFALARFLSRRSALDLSGKKRFEKLIAVLSQQHRLGHTCIEITDADIKLAVESGFCCEIRNTPQPIGFPLIVEHNRLYLQRYWTYETRLAGLIRQRTHVTPESARLDDLLDRYFPGSKSSLDGQRDAVHTACRSAFSIITGGPGTGKTTTVCKTLAVLQELAQSPLLIALTAPTGKAAMRLQEAVAQNLAVLTCSESVKRHLPRTAETIHRLLGANYLSPYFKHNADHPLVYDCVIVDEASMVDLALMCKLADALKPDARLVLLGDKDQLSSVESGAVLGDLIAGLPDHTIELTKSYRFTGTIKRFADAVNRQQTEIAWPLLNNQEDDRIARFERHQIVSYSVRRRETYRRLVQDGAHFHDIFQCFNSFQVLCANRQGQDGAHMISAQIENALFGERRFSETTAWYPGRPVLVTQNNPSLQLYNGDIGICLPDRDSNGRLMVFFMRPDGTFKKQLPSRMPNCESVFAMTVHKVQGSEFDEVLIVLPEKTNPVLSKELLYTALTRAKNRIALVTEKPVFDDTLNRKIERTSGLIDKLQSFESTLPD